MNALALAHLCFKNHVDQQGRWAYFSRAVPLCFLNILVLSTLFTTAKGNPLSVELLAVQYSYFIPLFGLSAAVGSWETELLAGIGEEYLLRPRWVLPSRALIAAAEVSFPLLFFGALLILSRREHLAAHLITMVLMLGVSVLLGTAIGFCFGFRHEKAVNNFINAVTWVLGFGPGPFFGNETAGWRSLFPGGFSLDGSFGLEWSKLVLVALVALVMLHAGKSPRRSRFFSR